MTGALYLLYFLTAILGQLWAGGKNAASAHVATDLSLVLYVVVTLLFYGMFKPVSGSLSLVAALFSLAGCAAMAFGLLRPAVASISPLVFFGPFCLLIGYLILRSSFLPRVLGVPMALAGLGWLAYLLPAVPHTLALAIEGLGIVAEGSLMLWLLAMGVNVARWNEQAGVAKAPFGTQRQPLPPTASPLSR